jgi:peroxiredoxin
MRKLFVFAALTASLAAGSLFAGDAPKKQPLVPRKAAEFVFNMADGPQRLLSMYRGKTVVLALMFATCPHCQKTSQVLTQVQTEYAPKGVQVLGAVFGQGDSARVQQFSKSLGLNFPIGYSEQNAVLQFLDVPVTDPYFVPILVFIDKGGIIRSQYIGDETFLQRKELNIRVEIDKMIGSGPGKPMAPKTSPKS